jgi:DNA/RNA-binding domain of Phe-tRNA-synthetase-like protein
MSVQFRYAPEIRARFPQLRTATVLVEGIDAVADASAGIARLWRMADQRLAAASEGEFPEIQAWRRAFSAMGLKPTQYRCASEALLRRYRKEGALPGLHPLIDLCNAASIAYAIPVAVFDASRIAGAMAVRPALGDEVYETFSGEIENPDPAEIIFADDEGRAHARRWANRQSGWSAIRPATGEALIVSEALHETAGDDVVALMASLAGSVGHVWPNAKLMEINAK